MRMFLRAVLDLFSDEDLRMYVEAHGGLFDYIFAILFIIWVVARSIVVVFLDVSPTVEFFSLLIFLVFLLMGLYNLFSIVTGKIAKNILIEREQIISKK